MEDFTIDKVSWHTQVPGNTETKQRIYHRFFIILKFLQENNLAKGVFIESENDINEYTAIKKSDLNEEGFLIMKSCYDKWLKYLDKGGKIDNLKSFQDKLLKIRKPETKKHS